MRKCRVGQLVLDLVTEQVATIVLVQAERVGLTGLAYSPDYPRAEEGEFSWREPRDLLDYSMEEIDA